jgi:mRNA-degrading endonuclease YafQ of YafQ-DinJ toxin-antitoxin module
LEQFEGDPFSPELRTHPLTGKLHGLHAFSVDADCRVVLRFIKANAKVLLIDIGTHEEVY